ncbi:MAG: hypothetical protein LUG13_09925 [Oscillospiraceae bacterium]|nr:hypothetical protein [Oscillospiraceae bacterium]
MCSTVSVVAYSTNDGMSDTRLTATATDDSGGVYNFIVEVSQGIAVAVL